MHKAPRRTFIPLIVVAAALTLIVNAMCGHLISYQLYRIGLGYRPTINDIRIVMKPGWYPIAQSEIGIAGWLFSFWKDIPYPIIVFNRAEGCTVDREFTVVALPKERLDATNIAANILDVKHYPWGIVEFLNKSMFKSKKTRYKILIRGSGFLLSTDDVSVLDDIIDMRHE